MNLIYINGNSSIVEPVVGEDLRVRAKNGEVDLGYKITDLVYKGDGSIDYVRVKVKTN